MTRQVSQRKFLHIFYCAFLVAFAASWASESPAQEVISREYTIKAAYLYNFARYVRWPDRSFENEQSPFVIGVMGTDPFGKDLEDIASSKNVEGREITLHRFTSLNDYKPCQILFVPRSFDPEQQAMTIQKLRSSPVLLVGETPAFAERGGTVNFLLEENKLRFEINQQAAERAGLRISAKLLSLATIVTEDLPQPTADGNSQMSMDEHLLAKP